MSEHSTPKNLAAEVYSALNKRSSRPKRVLLEELFETMYFASLKTEESELTAFDVVYLNPNDPDPRPPGRIMADRFRFIPFSNPIDLTISNLIKLTKASDPRTSSLVVYPTSKDQLLIWGLVDQGNAYYDFINRESSRGPQRPGIFQATAMGAGHVVTWLRGKKIAELKVDALITKDLDVLSDGPIRQVLNEGIIGHLQAVRASVGDETYDYRGHYDISLTQLWLGTICRLLLRIQKYHHGGAVLITPDHSQQGLNVKYEMKYDRLRTALEKLSVCLIQNTFASDQIFEYMEENSDSVPMDLYLDETVSDAEIEDIEQEIANAIWFVSLLSRVDGLVLMNSDLVVQGFGVEIMTNEEPKNIRLATTRFATNSNRMKRLDYKYYGTRHRSMMRYCYNVPSSLGFVISQDGDVRAMTRIGSALVVWDSIKLQRPEFMRRIQRRSGIQRDKRTGRFTELNVGRDSERF